MEFNLCRLAHEYLIYLATCQCLVTQNIFFTLVPTYYVGKVCAVQKNLTLTNSKTGDTRIPVELFRLASATTRILFSEIVPFSVKVRIEKYHVPTRPRFFETAAIPPTFIRRKKHEQDQFSVFPSLPATGHVYVLCTVPVGQGQASSSVVSPLGPLLPFPRGVAPPSPPLLRDPSPASLLRDRRGMAAAEEQQQHPRFLLHRRPPPPSHVLLVRCWQGDGDRDFENFP